MAGMFPHIWTKLTALLYEESSYNISLFAHDFGPQPWQIWWLVVDYLGAPQRSRKHSSRKGPPFGYGDMAPLHSRTGTRPWHKATHILLDHLQGFPRVNDMLNFISSAFTSNGTAYFQVLITKRSVIKLRGASLVRVADDKSHWVDSLSWDLLDLCMDHHGNRFSYLTLSSLEWYCYFYRRLWRAGSFRARLKFVLLWRRHSSD